MVHKDRNSLEKIAEWIKQTYPDDSGIVYGFSRNETEKVANKLVVSLSKPPSHFVLHIFNTPHIFVRSMVLVQDTIMLE